MKRLEDLAAELEATDLSPSDIQRIKQEIEELRNDHVHKDEAEEFVRACGATVITKKDMRKDTLPDEINDRFMPRRKYYSIRWGGYVVGAITGVLACAIALEGVKFELARELHASVAQLSVLEDHATVVRQDMNQLTTLREQSSREFVAVQSSLETYMRAYDQIQHGDEQPPPEFLNNELVMAAWPSVLSRVGSRECYYVYNTDVYRLDIATGETQILTLDRYEARQPTSNGDVVLYVVSWQSNPGYTPGVYNSHIYSMNRDGSNRQVRVAISVLRAPIDDIVFSNEAHTNTLAYLYRGIWHQVQLNEGRQDRESFVPPEISNMNYRFNGNILNGVELRTQADGIYVVAPELTAPVRVLERAGVMDVSW